MEAAMFGIKKVIVYIDNLLIHTASHEEHLWGLASVLERLWTWFEIELGNMCFL